MLRSLDVWPGYLFLYVPFAYTHAASHLMMYNGGGRFLELLFYLWFGGTCLICVVLLEYQYSIAETVSDFCAAKIVQLRQKKSSTIGAALLNMSPVGGAGSEPEDSDVAAERARVGGGGVSSDTAIVIRGMIKLFSTAGTRQTKVAVDDLFLSMN